ncbi:ALP1-like protein [Tanacetum coccineum]
MRRSLITRIVRELTHNVTYFQQSSDCTRKVEISTLMKCASAIRQLVYGTVLDSLDKYLQMGVKTSYYCLKKNYKDIMELYANQFSRKHTQTDVEKLYVFHEEKHWFPEMLESIDCMNWEWLDCPTALKAQSSRGDHRSNPFILFEAVSSQDL